MESSLAVVGLTAFSGFEDFAEGWPQGSQGAPEGEMIKCKGVKNCSRLRDQKTAALFLDLIRCSKKGLAPRSPAPNPGESFGSLKQCLVGQQ